MKIEDIKWLEGFYNADISNKRLFAATFGVYPNTYAHIFKQEIILDKLLFDTLKKMYPNAIIQSRIEHFERNTSCVDYMNTSCIDFNPVKVPLMENLEGAQIDIYDDNLIISFTAHTFYIYYIDQDIQAHIDSLLKVVQRKNELKAAQVKLIAYSNGFYTIDSKIEATDINLSENYNDDFMPAYDNIINFLDERKSGLIIIRGEKGTGKTNLLRHLMTTHPDNYVIVTNATASYLAAPEFMTFMMEHQNSVFILEDCEQILMDRSESFNNAIATILNMSDGLLSDIFNVKFICTFNADINKIDEALLRKGRCFVNYEFTKLSADKTKVLLNKQGIELDEYEPMTLADIYNYEAPKCVKEDKKKIGF